MARVITDLEVKHDYRSVRRVRFVVAGGSTGDHMVTYLADSANTGEWNCTCIGFVSHKKCRHVKSGNIILEKVGEALALIKTKEIENWKNKQT